MFKKINRLSRTEFNHYFKMGRRFHSENFTLIHSPALQINMAVVVGKKVFKEAVDRNRLRRRIFASSRGYFKDNSITVGVCLIIAKPTAKKIERKAIRKEIYLLLALAPKAR